MTKSFFVFNHQNKASMYIEALTRHGWIQTKRIDDAKFVLSDADIYRRAKTLEEYGRRGRPIFLYPHSAIPNLFWDFPGVKYSNVINAQFVPSEGHVEIMRSYGNPYTIHVVGWHLCPLEPFKPRELTSILFAPIHPNSNGFLCKLDKEINVETFRRLLEISRVNNVKLNVRYLQNLPANGLWNEPGVNFVLGEPDQNFSSIDRAGVVVAHHTFAYMAVARGVPTVMMGEWHAPRMGPKEHEMITAKSWGQYKHLLMYPMDILDPYEDPAALLKRACAADVEIEDWRSRMIGEPFDAEKFAALVEGHLYGKKEHQETIK